MTCLASPVYFGISGGGTAKKFTFKQKKNVLNYEKERNPNPFVVLAAMLDKIYSLNGYQKHTFSFLFLLKREQNE